MYPVAKPPLEPVVVYERHEQLEILLLAVVRGGRHQQEVPGEAGQELSQVITLGVPGLASEEAGGHLVGFVAYHQVPFTVGGLELLLHLFVTGQLVQPGDRQIGFQEPVPRVGRFELVVGQNFKGELEPAGKLVLPLFSQRAWADHQTPLDVSPGNQLLDQQSRHDGLAGPWVVRQQESKREPRQH